jgi:hypothetical protein
MKASMASLKNDDGDKEYLTFRISLVDYYPKYSILQAISHVISLSHHFLRKFSSSKQSLS